MAEDHGRLERIEAKLDSVGEALVALARLDERMITLFKRMQTLDDQQSDQSNRLVKLEGNVGSNGASLRFAERVFWIVLAAVVTFAFKGGL
jgi:hypothetical protein|tara:strand:+ start:1371 stop:1643 length:273 start_codon:yes stop_codon:yes gene_type:complete